MGFLSHLIRKRTPKDQNYFELLDELSKNVVESARIFCAEKNSAEKKAAILFELEHKADTIVHTIFDKLDMHADPPLDDRDDIQRLIYNIDNIIDLLEEAADRMVRFHLEYDAFFKQCGDLIFTAASEIQKGISLLKDIPKNHKSIKQCCITINDAEHKGDVLHRKFISLMAEELDKSPDDIRIRDYYNFYDKVAQLLEDALDQCEDVAELIDSLKKKNA